MQKLFDGELGNVPAAADQTGLAIQTLSFRFQNGSRKIYQTITGGFWSDVGTTIGGSLSGEHANRTVGKALVLAEHIADLSSPYTDVSGGNIGILADVAGELSHEALAETHDLIVAFPFRIEVASSLSAAHCEPGQAVLECLLEGKELEDGEVYRRVEPQATLVRTYG
ncbi:hypothetical protein SDC9_121918 [bioreactor metagenome]|uniref:Uncharacterized protein n=1 Tax=bioreactor metagenome TaxID=1076179 RepID=A0A645CDA9_9ZZZZ